MVCTTRPAAGPAGERLSAWGPRRGRSDVRSDTVARQTAHSYFGLLKLGTICMVKMNGHRQLRTSRHLTSHVLLQFRGSRTSWRCRHHPDWRGLAIAADVSNRLTSRSAARRTSSTHSASVATVSPNRLQPIPTSDTDRPVAPSSRWFILAFCYTCVGSMQVIVQSPGRSGCLADRACRSWCVATGPHGAGLSQRHCWWARHLVCIRRSTGRARYRGTVSYGLAERA